VAGWAGSSAGGDSDRRWARAKLRKLARLQAHLEQAKALRGGEDTERRPDRARASSSSEARDAEPARD
jgi:hypothetical protein